jgi:hypothetical protein
VHFSATDCKDEYRGNLFKQNSLCDILRSAAARCKNRKKKQTQNLPGFSESGPPGLPGGKTSSPAFEQEVSVF